MLRLLTYKIQTLITCKNAPASYIAHKKPEHFMIFVY